MHHSGWLENDSVSSEINQVWVGTPIPPKHDYWKGSIAKLLRFSGGVKEYNPENWNLKTSFLWKGKSSSKPPCLYFMLRLRSVPQLTGSSDMTQQILQLRMVIMGWVAVSRSHCSTNQEATILQHKLQVRELCSPSRLHKRNHAKHPIDMKIPQTKPLKPLSLRLLGATCARSI